MMDNTRLKGASRGESFVIKSIAYIVILQVRVPTAGRAQTSGYDRLLAPNSPFRSAVTAMAPVPVIPAISPDLQTIPSDEEVQAHAKRSPARYLWAKLIARIYEVFPSLCLHCGGQMRLIAFINDSAEIRKILDHVGVESTPPKISQARGPPLWDACDEAEPKEYFDDGVDYNIGQHGPDDDVDQSVNW